MRAVIDRFEGDIAVVEMDDGAFVNVRRSMLPAESTEGSALTYCNGAWESDTDGQRERSERIARKMASLFR